MISLDKIKEKISDKDINSYVACYLAIRNQFDNLEDEFLDGNLTSEDYNSILDIHEHIADKIAEYYIDNYYLN